MADTCTVSGTLLAPDGSPLVNATVVFERSPKRVYPASPDTIAPHTIRTQTNGSGAVSVDLVPAAYMVSTQGSSYPAFQIVVPDESSANLADIQDAMPEPYITQAQAIVVQVEAARDDAEEARDDAQALYGDLSAVNQAKIDAQNAAAGAEALFGDLSAVAQAVIEAEDAADSASNSLAAAQAITGGAQGIGTQPLELPRNTELGSAAYTPYQPLSLYPIVTTGATTLTPDDAGKTVWAEAHDITLPDTAAPGMEVGSWRIWVKNTHTSSSLTIDCGGASDTIDGGASLSLAAGESILIVMIADGEFGSL